MPWTKPILVRLAAHDTGHACYCSHGRGDWHAAVYSATTSYVGSSGAPMPPREIYVCTNAAAKIADEHGIEFPPMNEGAKK